VRRHLLSLLSLLVFLAAPAAAAPPVLPQGIPYQGVLLDSAGQPQTGAVDLTVRIYDEILGGNLVYKEVFLGTPLVDGVFTIELGPGGSPTDTPTDPLTTSLTDALTADVGATGGGRYIEVQVRCERGYGGGRDHGARYPERRRARRHDLRRDLAALRLRRRAPELRSLPGPPGHRR
jgi:hypothetical protein